MSNNRQKSAGDVSPRHMEFKAPFIRNRKIISDYYTERAAESKKGPPPLNDRQLKREAKKQQIAEHVRAGRTKMWIKTEVGCGIDLIDETTGDMFLGKYGGY